MTADTAARNAQLIAEALTAAGFDPVPAVGQVWHHHTVTLPNGCQRWVRITGIYHVEAGWSVTVDAYHGKPTDNPDWMDVRGVIFVKTLVRDYTLIEGATR